MWAKWWDDDEDEDESDGWDKGGVSAFTNSLCIKHTHTLFPFSFFFLGRLVCWAALSVYTAYISRTHIILRVRRPSFGPYTQSPIQVRRRRLRPRPLSLPFGSFRLSVIYKKKKNKKKRKKIGGKGRNVSSCLD